MRLVCEPDKDDLQQTAKMGQNATESEKEDEPIHDDDQTDNLFSNSDYEPDHKLNYPLLAVMAVAGLAIGVVLALIF